MFHVHSVYNTNVPTSMLIYNKPNNKSEEKKPFVNNLSIEKNLPYKWHLDHKSKWQTIYQMVTTKCHYYFISVMPARHWFAMKLNFLKTSSIAYRVVVVSVILLYYIVCLARRHIFENNFIARLWKVLIFIDWWLWMHNCILLQKEWS